MWQWISIKSQYFKVEEQYPKEALNKFRQWHFWWLVVFSFLLIITFVYYLPTRFLQQTGVPHGQEEEEHMMDEHMQEHMKNGMTEGEMMKHMEEEHEKGMMSGEDMMSGDMAHEGENMMSGGDNHGNDNHATASYFEEFDVKKGLAVNLNARPVPYKVGAPLTLDFFVNEKPSNIPVFADQLQIEHEKLMHVIGVRSDMNEFFHIHPEPVQNDSSIFSMNQIFQKPGLYKIWSEVKKDGINYTFGHPELSVIGSGNKSDKKVSFERNVMAGDYQVSLSMNEPIVKASEADLSFDIHTLTGMEVDTENLLGAKMHLTIIKDDLKQFIHTHPENGQGHSFDFIQSVNAHGPEKESQSSVSGDETINFHVIFPEAGLYKAFAQFRPKGSNLFTDEALTASFWIDVADKAPLPISPWWSLLLISIALIIGLSWGVSKYINVKNLD